MKHLLPLILLAVLSCNTQGQGYTSYHTGSSTDITTSPEGGICLMGGATEDDNAMVWFLERAQGGDVLVLRASGSDGYNDYFYSDLGVTLNSVETIVFNNITAATSSYIHEKIAGAEAIWFAGGDQYDYVTYFRDTPIKDLLNEAITERNIVVGGTSAGMAIMGEYYFSAENGTITSEQALANPYHPNITVEGEEFLLNHHLQHVITDTHYDDPNRKGRHVVFMSRIFTDYDIPAKGIACEEYVAVCVTPEGIASVYGEYPAYDDFAYFIQTNCEVVQNEQAPSTCEPNTPLTWDADGEALFTYQVPGTSTGSNYFNLNNWTEGAGGQWQVWTVDTGELIEEQGDQPHCHAAVQEVSADTPTLIYPNPANDFISIEFTEGLDPEHLRISSSNGDVVFKRVIKRNGNIRVDTSTLPSGLYVVETRYANGQVSTEKLLLQD